MENILLKEAIIMANSNNMCRLCLSANGITEPICYDQRDQFLLQKIYECTTLQVSPLNGIPSSLCTICKARLDEFYQFRWQCIKNDEIIRRIADNFQKQSTEPASHNPKQELVEPQHGGDIQLPTGPEGSSEYTSSEERRSDERQTPVSYQHSKHVAPRPEQNSYTVGEHSHHGHSQYSLGGVQGPSMGPIGGEHVTGFPPETKYTVPPGVAHQFEFTDFRRKRGRPPKQKYDQYHHPIVKYGENSIEPIKTPDSMDCSDSSTMVEEPETILTYGDSATRATEEYSQETTYGAWVPQPKIKLEQIENQQVRYDEQPPAVDIVHEQNREHYIKLPSTSTVQTILTSDGFVKRSRGRPPREGGCPNQDRTEYRFQCQFCDARFKAAINLKLHTNTHTGERPYKCQMCDKSFAHPSNLSVHTKLHSQERVKREGVPSEKKFQCPYCHTLFALAFQLKIHINTHTGQKPYVCKNCGKGFAQPSNLHVHAKKHCHKKIEYEAHRLGAPQQDPHQPSSHPPPQEVLQQQQQQQLHYQPIQLLPHPLPLVLSASHQQPPEQQSPHMQPTLSPDATSTVPNQLPAHHQPPTVETTMEHSQQQHHQEQHHSPPASTQPHPMSMPPVMLV